MTDDEGVCRDKEDDTKCSCNFGVSFVRASQLSRYSHWLLCILIGTIC